MEGQVCLATSSVLHADWTPAELQVGVEAVLKVIFFFLSLSRSAHPATRATVRLTEKMAAAGADAALVVTPCFYKGKMSSRALIQHFSKVSRRRRAGYISQANRCSTLKASLKKVALIRE